MYIVYAWVESKLYNCCVICFVHVTEDHRIWSLEKYCAKKVPYKNWVISIGTYLFPIVSQSCQRSRDQPRAPPWAEEERRRPMQSLPWPHPQQLRHVCRPSPRCDGQNQGRAGSHKSKTNSFTESHCVTITCLYTVWVEKRKRKVGFDSKFLKIEKRYYKTDFSAW